MKKAFVGIVVGLLLVAVAISGYTRAEDHDSKGWPGSDVEYKNKVTHRTPEVRNKKLSWHGRNDDRTYQGAISFSVSDQVGAGGTASVGLKEIFGISVTLSFSRGMSRIITLQPNTEGFWYTGVEGMRYDCSANKYVDGKYVGRVTAAGWNPHHEWDELITRRI